MGWCGIFSMLVGGSYGFPSLSRTTPLGKAESVSCDCLVVDAADCWLKRWPFPLRKFSCSGETSAIFAWIGGWFGRKVVSLISNAGGGGIGGFSVGQHSGTVIYGAPAFL